MIGDLPRVAANDRPRIYPLVLCGGMGSRLWPLSRVEQPKQFQPTAGKDSLSYFQATIQRHRGAQFCAPIVVTSARHVTIVRRQLEQLQIDGHVIAEPVGRNTGPAVLAAALSVIRHDPEAQLLVLPSDHVIKGDLNSTVTAMSQAADDGRIITFGIMPRYAETGYGYITDGGSFDVYPGLHRVLQFVEKPPLSEAEALLSAGGAYWASGISLFRADTLIGEFARLEPESFVAVSRAVSSAEQCDDHILLDEATFTQARAEPTERLVFERSDAVALAPVCHIDWNDVGAWTSVHAISDKCGDGNVTNGDVISLNTKNSLIHGDDRLVAVVGMEDVIVVDTPDAVLVTNQQNAQMVKSIVDRLKDQNRCEVTTHKLRDLSWGSIEALSSADEYRMKMVTVRPDATMMLNGTGEGPSLLAVISGQGAYQEGGAEKSISSGDTISVAADLCLPLRNASTQPFQAILLTILNGVVPTGPVLAHA